MPDLHSIINEYLEFANKSGLPIDRSIFKYPELLPMCREMGITYDEAIEAISGHSINGSFFSDLIAIIVDQQKQSDEDFNKTIRILSAIENTPNFRLVN